MTWSAFLEIQGADSAARNWILDAHYAIWDQNWELQFRPQAGTGLAWTLQCLGQARPGLHLALQCCHLACPGQPAPLARAVLACAGHWLGTGVS